MNPFLKRFRGVKYYFVGDLLANTSDTFERIRIKVFFWYCVLSTFPLIIFIPFLVYERSLIQLIYVGFTISYFIANLFYVRIFKDFKKALILQVFLLPILIWSLIVFLLPSDYSIFLTCIYISACFIVFTIEQTNWIYVVFLFTVLALGLSSHFEMLGYQSGELLGIEMVDQTYHSYSIMIKIGAPMLLLFLGLDNFMRITKDTYKELNESIIKQKELNLELIESRKQYKSLVEEARELVYEINDKGQFKYTNRAFQVLTGYSADFIQGSKYGFILHPNARESSSKYFEKRKLKDIERTYEEFPIISKSGQTYWLGQNTRIVKNEDGKSQTYFCIARDITVEKRLNKKLIDAKEVAEKASLIKTQFLSAMSHELRTPINAFMGTLHLMEEEKPRVDQIHHLDTLKTSAENLMNLVAHLLDYNDLDSNNVKLMHTSFNLRRAACGAANNFRQAAKQKGLDFSIEFDEKIPEKLLGDSIRINQIISHLLDNAVKFTSSGFVKFKISLLKRKENQCRILFSIQDSGVGIVPEKIDHIFEKFTQGHDETILEGTGLGLAVSKKIAQLMDSDIKVESKLGSGSIFSFILDLEVVQVSTDMPNLSQLGTIISKKSDLAKSLSGINVLLVEDNIINQKVAGKLLANWGATHTIAGNGKIALEKVQMNNYDVILMDVQMPVMDGIEATKEIRKLGGKYKTLPIIALTASAVMEVRKSAIDAGLDEFVTKPFKPEALNSIIQSFVKSKVKV